MIYYIPFTTRARTFHHFTMIALKQSTNQPISLRCSPVQKTVFHPIRKIYSFCKSNLPCLLLISCDSNQRQTFFIPNLCITILLQIPVRSDRFFHIVNIHFRTVLSINQRLTDIFYSLSQSLPLL